MYSYRTVPHCDETEWYDAAGHRETWRDMVRLQNTGLYPASFASIGVPVVMIHGDHDPHPGRSTFDCLRAFMPHMEYVELPCCGHYPWWEEFGREAFFGVLRDRLARGSS